MVLVILFHQNNKVNTNSKPKAWSILNMGNVDTSAGYKYRNNATIYEAIDRFGGLCDNFIFDGLRFPFAIHLLVAKEENV
jgi:hypothetical protein